MTPLLSAMTPPRLALLLLLIFTGGQLLADGDASSSLPPPSVLKKLTVEQLMDLDVTSVSKRPERLFDTASAVQVISAEDYRSLRIRFSARMRAANVGGWAGLWMRVDGRHVQAPGGQRQR